MSAPALGSLDRTASEYLRTIPLQVRRQSGQVYTPRHLSQFILDQAGFPSDEPRTLLDPACGAGAFIETAIELLAVARSRRGQALTKPRARTAFLREVKATIYGVDIDHHAVDLARQAARAAVAKACGIEPPKTFFDRTLLCADYLTDSTVQCFPPPHSGGFDFIVGNPPYVSALRIDAGSKRELRRRYTTAQGRIDLYTLFIERSVELLDAQGGRLAFITPDKFLLSQTSEALRRLLLAKGALLSLARFRSHKIFEDAATVPCVTVYERGGKPQPIALLECGERTSKLGAVTILRRSQLSPAILATPGGWSLAHPTLRQLEQRIQGVHPQLKTYLTRLSAGIATGYDSLYLSPADSKIDVEEALLHPTVRGRDITAFSIADSQLRMLVPYRFNHGRPQLVALADYPRARRYLEKHRAALEARHCVRVWEKAWYDLHDAMPCDMGRLPKILVPDVASHNRFAFDPGRYWPLHSAYYLVPNGIEPQFLVGVLNSAPIEFLIRLRAPVVKDGFSRYRKQFLEPLPIPYAKSRQRRAIASAAEDGDVDAVDRLMFALFEVSPRDVQQIRDFLASRIEARR